MISLSSLVMLIVYLVVAGLIAWLLFWLIDFVGIPEPFHKIAKVIIAVFCVLVCIGVLLSLAGGQPLFRP